MLQFWMIFLYWNQVEIWKKNILFHCLPLWKTVLFVSSRAFSLSTPTFLLFTPVENSEATWKKATKCDKEPLPCQLLEIWRHTKSHWCHGSITVFTLAFEDRRHCTANPICLPWFYLGLDSSLKIHLMHIIFVCLLV